MIDKALTNWSDYQLNWNGDLVMVEWDWCNLQSAQNRCISLLWSWVYEDSFWCSIYDDLKDKSVYKITEQEVSNSIYKALEPMILDWRVKELISTKILSRTPDSIVIEIKIKLDTTIWVINYNLSI